MSIDFEFPSPFGGVFRDALDLPEDHGLSDDALATMKQTRFNAWVAHVEAASQEPTPEA